MVKTSLESGYVKYGVGRLCVVLRDAVDDVSVPGLLWIFFLAA